MIEVTLDDVDGNLVIERMKSMEREMYNSNDPRAELVREFMDFLTEHGVIAPVTATKLELSYEVYGYSKEQQGVDHDL